VSHVEHELITLPQRNSSPPVFSGVRVVRSLVFCVMFYISLFVLFAIVLSVLRLTASDYPFGFFKHFLCGYRSPMMHVNRNVLEKPKQPLIASL